MRPRVASAKSSSSSGGSAASGLAVAPRGDARSPVCAWRSPGRALGFGAQRGAGAVGGSVLGLERVEQRRRRGPAPISSVMRDRAERPVEAEPHRRVHVGRRGDLLFEREGGLVGDLGEEAGEDRRARRGRSCASCAGVEGRGRRYRARGRARARSPRRSRSSRGRSCGRAGLRRPGRSWIGLGRQRSGSPPWAKKERAIVRLTSSPIRSSSSNGPMRKPPPRRTTRSIVAASATPSPSIRSDSSEKGRARRLATKPGLSLARIGVRPIASATSVAVASAASEECSAATTSTSFISAGGLKKCMPTTRSGRARRRRCR